MSAKQAYEEKIEAQMDKLNAGINSLKAKSKEASADAKIEYNKQIQDLENNKNAAQSKLQEIKNASTDAWEDLKEGFQNAADDLGEAINSAKKHFK